MSGAGDAVSALDLGDGEVQKVVYMRGLPFERQHRAEREVDVLV